MTRGGAARTRDAPERRCIVTRLSGPKSGLIRFVVGPDDAIVPDLAERLPGHGIWVGADRAALEKAAGKGLFARAAKRAVRVPPDLADSVEAMLAARLIDRISMARKAGEAVTGFEKTKAALVSGKAALLLQASDGSERGRTALRPPQGGNRLVDCLTARELGLAFGRDNVIHAAVLAGGLGERIGNDALRLAGVRAGLDRRTSRDAAANGLAGERPRGKG
jgi:predicted RNA-binding protein YlxR (DUF448 family)